MNIPCPSRDSWRQSLSGVQSDSELSPIADHLETCEKCAIVFEELSSEDPLFQGLDDLPETDPNEVTMVIKDLLLGQFPQQPRNVSNIESTPLPPMLLGPFRIGRKLGQGGMGIVYEATDERLNRPVAVKILHPASAADPEVRDRFLLEARAAARVRHENVVTIHEVGEYGGVPCLAMELLVGESLADRIAEPVDPVEAVRIAVEAATGLVAAHEAGVVHRDVKPENLWVCPSGRVKLLDFGLARCMLGTASRTSRGIVVGTPHYMSPEQARGEPTDHRSDIYSLGVVLYRMLIGQLPFPGDEPLVVIAHVASGRVAPLHTIAPHFPVDLTRLVDRMLAINPDERPVNIVPELAGIDLQEKATLQPRRRRREKVLAIFLGSLFALMTVGIFSYLQEPNQFDPEVSRLRTQSAEDWVAEVTQLPAAQQGLAVAARLKQLNPQFDGRFTRGLVEDGVLTEIGFVGTHIHDISPLAALKGLKWLDCSVVGSNQGELTDLSPLAGLTLRELYLRGHTRLTDLTPLRTMPLRAISIYRCGVTDISPICTPSLDSFEGGGGPLTDLKPLTGTRITRLTVNECQITDLSPLRHLPLEHLEVANTRVSNIEPISRVPLVYLSVAHTAVTDISPLKSPSLLVLDLRETHIGDLSPLQKLPLRELNLDYQPAERAGLLRKIPTLQMLNGRPVEEELREE
jgi:eukaryotic-like serine/threonine-protein kinase